MAFQTLNINGRIRMNSRVMNENGREGWTEKTYQAKNQEKGNHYNFARHNLNFEIVHGGAVQQLDNSLHVPIEQRLNARLKDLGFNYYKEDSKNAPYSVADIIVGGDHELMSDIAFGNGENIENYFKQQETEDFFMGFHFEDDMNLFDRESYEPTPTKKPKIIQWAEDNYRFFCEQFGEENIISFSVHLDETTPHAHVLAIPTAMKKQRGRVKSGAARKAKEVVSFKSHFGDLSKANSRKAAYQRWHDEYYRAVGKKWGFERGRDLDQMSPDEKAEHTHLHKNDLDTRNKLRAENKALQEQKSQLMGDVQTEENKLQQVNKTVANKETRANDLDTTLIRKRMELTTLTSDIATKQAEKESLDNSISAKQQEVEKQEEKAKKAQAILDVFEKEKSKLLNMRRNINKDMFSYYLYRHTSKEQHDIINKKCFLATAMYINDTNNAQKILADWNGQQLIMPKRGSYNDEQYKVACLVQAEKLLNLPKIEQEQERGHGFKR